MLKPENKKLKAYSIFLCSSLFLYFIFFLSLQMEIHDFDTITYNNLQGNIFSEVDIKNLHESKWNGKQRTKFTISSSSDHQI